MPGPYVEVTKRTGQRIVRMLNSFEQGRGGYFGPTGTAIAPPKTSQRPILRPPPGIIPVIVTGSTQDGSNFRWTYDFEEAEKTSAGYGGWTAKENGLTGTAYNIIEDQNGASGVFGNGVDSANLAGTFELQPVPNGTRIAVWRQHLTDGTFEYWFSYENGVDGAC
jgi:hypothetical protein